MDHGHSGQGTPLHQPRAAVTNVLGLREHGKINVCGEISRNSWHSYFRLIIVDIMIICYLAVDPQTINGTLISRKLQGSKNTFE